MVLKQRVPISALSLSLSLSLCVCVCVCVCFSICLYVSVCRCVQDCELAELRLTIDKLSNSAPLQLASSLSIASPATNIAAAATTTTTTTGLSVCAVAPVSVNQFAFIILDYPHIVVHCSSSLSRLVFDKWKENLYVAIICLLFWGSCFRVL